VGITINYGSFFLVFEGDHDSLASSFCWNETREGQSYWSRQCDGMIPVAYVRLSKMLAESIPAPLEFISV